MDVSVSPMATSTQKHASNELDMDTSSQVTTVEETVIPGGDDIDISAGEATLAAVAEDTEFSIDAHPESDIMSPATTVPDVRPKVTDSQKDDARKSSRPREKQKKGTTQKMLNIHCSSDCKRGRASTGDMTRCNMCMVWYHDQCMDLNDDDSGMWMCMECRRLPDTVSRLLTQVESLTQVVVTVQPMMKEITNEMKSLQETNSALIHTLTSKITDITRLSQENGALKQQLSMTQERLTYAKSMQVPTIEKTLLIGSSMMKHMKSTKNHVSVESHPGGYIKDITDELMQIPESIYNTVTLHVGSNDCTTERSPSDIIKEYQAMVCQAKRVAQKVNVSTILPRMDDHSAHQKARRVNQMLRNGAQQGNFTLIDNDKNFYLRDDAIDDSVFWRDNLHLNKRGTTRLISNLGLTDHVQIYIQNNGERGTAHSITPGSGGPQNIRKRDPPTQRGPSVRGGPPTGRPIYWWHQERPAQRPRWLCVLWRKEPYLGNLPPWRCYY